MAEVTDKEEITPNSTLEEAIPTKITPSPKMTQHKSANSCRTRLTAISQMYDIDGDGQLDEAEMAMRNMDTSGRGYLTNEKVYNLMQDHIKVQKDLFKSKKVIIGLLAFVVLLALSNLGTSFAAAFLAKDTTTNSQNQLVSSQSKQVLGTQSMSEQFEARRVDAATNDGSSRNLVQIGVDTYIAIPSSDGNQHNGNYNGSGDEWVGVELDNGVTIERIDSADPASDFRVYGDLLTQDENQKCDIDADCDGQFVCASNSCKKVEIEVDTFEEIEETIADTMMTNCQSGKSVNVKRTFSNGQFALLSLCSPLLTGNYVSNGAHFSSQSGFSHSLLRNSGATTYSVDGDGFTQDQQELCDVDRDCDDEFSCILDTDDGNLRCAIPIVIQTTVNNDVVAVPSSTLINTLSGGCLEDNKHTTVTCSPYNDIHLKSFTLTEFTIHGGDPFLNTDTGIWEGACRGIDDYVTVSFNMNFKVAGGRYYDVGMYINTEGGNAMNGVCTVAPLTNGTFDGPGANVVIGEFEDIPDKCWDIEVESGSELEDYAFRPLTLKCADTNADGLLDFDIAIAWAEETKNEECDIDDPTKWPIPDSRSRCSYDANNRVTLGIAVPPYQAPSSNPSGQPSVSFSPSTSKAPTTSPTFAPTSSPTKSPSKSPTTSPTTSPSASQSPSLSLAPTRTDTVKLLIPEAVDYHLVYELDIPTNPNYGSAGPQYIVDNSIRLPDDLERIAYYLELDDTYVWVSFDAFTNDARKIGVPCLHSTCWGDGQSPNMFNKLLTNVSVVSNEPGLSGSGLQGIIEFWPFDYIQRFAGSSSSIMSADGNYGSMQILLSSYETVFAFNSFNMGDVADLGIGGNTAGQYTDWTEAHNAGSYSVRKLKAYATKMPTSSPTLAPTSSPTKNPSKSPTTSPTASPSTSPLKSPTASPTASPSRTPTTSPSKAPTTSPTTSAPTTSPTTSQSPSQSSSPSLAPSDVDPVKLLIPEASDYRMAYELDIPTNPSYGSAGPQYAVDNSPNLQSHFARIAYYLELDDKYVWVSFDAFTTDVRKIGIPCLHSSCWGDDQSPNIFQQWLTNMNVISSEDGLSVNGTSGFVEFWPYDYNAKCSQGTVTSNCLDGANDFVYDFDDTMQASGSYGSMQVHDYANRKTIFAFNNFNNGNFADLGVGNNVVGSNYVHSDWTGQSNAGSYSVRKLKIYTSFLAAAEYSATYLVPFCPVPAIACSSEDLLVGRGASVSKFGLANSGEPNHPNTLVTAGNICQDGSSNGNERVEKIVVKSGSTTALLKEGLEVTIEATVYPYLGGDDNYADFYYASDASNPDWQFIATVSATCEPSCDMSAPASLKTLSVPYTLPSGTTQAVRVGFRWQGIASICSNGLYDESDDLVFTVIPANN